MSGLLKERLSEQMDDTAPERKKTNRTSLQGKSNSDRSIVRERSVSKAVDSFSSNEEDDEERQRDREEEYEREYKRSSVITEEDMKELRELDDLSSEERNQKHERRARFAKRITMIFLSVLCVYIVMLIYGTFVTQYEYDDNGMLAPIEMSIDEISARNDYNEIISYYLQARGIYEKILVLDYRVANEPDNLVVIATEYDEIRTKDISKVLASIEASTLSTKYNQILSMIHTFEETYLVSYCNYISVALSETGDVAEQAKTEAIAGRTEVEKNFQAITSNIIALGENVKGYDLTDIREWSPNGYITETILGIKEE